MRRPAVVTALERTTIDGLVFDTVWTHDGAGRVETLRSPGGIAATTAYGSGLRPQSVFVSAGQTEATDRCSRGFSS